MSARPQKVETSGSLFVRVLIVPPSSSSSSTNAGPVTRDSWEPLSSRSYGVLLGTRYPIGPVLASHNVLNVENEHFKWTKYVLDTSARGRLSRVVTEAALELWKFLLERVPNIEVPQAGPTEGGGLLMAWERDRHYFELEVSPSGRYDWFYRDHEEDRYWGAEDCTVGSYSEDLFSTIRRVWPDTESKRQIEFAMVGGERP